MTHIRDILIMYIIILLVVIMVVSAERLPNYGINNTITNLTIRSYESVEIFLPENATSGYQWKVINATGLSFLNSSISQYGGREGVIRIPGTRSFFVSHAEIGNQTFSAALMKENEIAPGDDGKYNLTLNVW